MPRIFHLRDPSLQHVSSQRYGLQWCQDETQKLHLCELYTILTHGKHSIMLFISDVVGGKRTEGTFI